MAADSLLSASSLALVSGDGNISELDVGESDSGGLMGLAPEARVFVMRVREVAADPLCVRPPIL